MKRSTLVLWSVLLLLASLAGATPVPVLSLSELIDLSDVIVVGSALTTTDSGVWLDATGARNGRMWTVDIEVDRVLKGVALSNSVQFQLPVSDRPVGYGSVRRGSYRVFFLKTVKSRLEPTSVYYPSVPAGRVAASNASDPAERVIEAVAVPITADGTAVIDRVEAIMTLRGVRSRFASAALHRAMQSADFDVRMRSAESLLSVDDVSALPIVESALLRRDLDASSVALSVAFTISAAVRDPAAVPVLSRLLSAPGVDVRRSVSHALRLMRSPEAATAMRKALDDRDVMVQYDAVLGFAELTGQTKWGPSIPAFRQEPATYLKYWKDWLRDVR